MTIVFDSNHCNGITYIQNSVCAKFCGKETQFELLYAKKCPKRLKKPEKRNLARNFKHMTIAFDSNHFHRLTYTK